MDKLSHQFHGSMEPVNIDQLHAPTWLLLVILFVFYFGLKFCIYFQDKK